MTRPRIAWFTIARAPYHDFFFGKLAARVDLTVVYFEKRATHPWQLGLASHDARYLVDDARGALRLAWSADAIVFQGWNEARILALMALLPPRTPKAFWTDTPRVDRLPGWKHRIREGVVAAVFRRFDQVWSTGRAGVEALAALGCPRAKIRSLPFFTDLEPYAEATEATRAAARAFRREHGDEARVVFLSSGRLVAFKRVDDALRALASLPERAVLWVAGEGPERARWEALARELGVEARTRFLGWIEPADTGRLLLAADVLVHPAERDAFPNVVLEAMAWARPVVGSTGAGSVVDRVSEGRNGFSFAPRDWRGLAAQMRRFVDDPALSDRLGAAARRTACEHPYDEGIALVEALLDVD